MGRKKVLEDELNDLEGKLQRAEKLVTGGVSDSKPKQQCYSCILVVLFGLPAAHAHTHETLLGLSAHPPNAFIVLASAGLAGERVRWESSISGYEGFLAALPGDALLAAAFLSYAGPFPSEFRDELVKGTWVPQVRSDSAAFSWCWYLHVSTQDACWGPLALTAAAMRSTYEQAPQAYLEAHLHTLTALPNALPNALSPAGEAAQHPSQRQLRLLRIFGSSAYRPGLEHTGSAR